MDVSKAQYMDVSKAQYMKGQAKTHDGASNLVIQNASQGLK